MTIKKLDEVIDHAIEKMRAVAVVEVRDGDILVTLPGTSYAVTYYKPASSPQLLARNLTLKDDSRASMTQSEFLALAWKLANERAKELGWIV
jgi:hypothetical protein